MNQKILIEYLSKSKDPNCNDAAKEIERLERENSNIKQELNNIHKLFSKAMKTLEKITKYR